MLKQLLINHIILIDKANISFQEGLNVISGETGSGKSAVMNALSLVLGGKSDVKMIRRGSEKGIVEAFFEIDKIPLIHHLLEEAGIDHEKDEDLVIRREINLNGKSRCFINHQAAQVSFLRQIGDLLANMIGQHANQWLLSTEKHRETIDIFGVLQQDVVHFSQSFLEETLISKQLNDLIENEAKRFREIEICQNELEELQEANLKNGEDEEVFEEYTLLTNAESRALKIHEITEALSGERQSIIAILNRQKSNLEEVAEIDASLEETAMTFKNALIEIEEVLYTLNAYSSRIEYNPKRVNELNERLSLITKLKKKYGPSLTEIANYQAETLTKLEILQTQDFLIDDLKVKLSALKKKNDQLASELTLKRKEIAKKFEAAMMQELHTLNMPKVVFEVEVKEQKRTSKGDERIEFYLIPNVGEHKIPIKESASGGELSRLLLAIQTLLAGKELISTLIFDEIDANIGGETALIVGEKLKNIGKNHQVLCITHFPQVAKQADHHLRIYKEEENGRTTTKINSLDQETKTKEISRMVGIKIIDKI